MILRFDYYEAVAHMMGVPDFWKADAGQDIALTCWKRGNDGARTVRSAAIDAARKYGPHGRRGERPQIINSEGMKLRHDDPDVGRLLDFREAVKRLTGKQRRAIERRVAGELMSSTDSGAARDARRKLRLAMAG